MKRLIAAFITIILSVAAIAAHAQQQQSAATLNITGVNTSRLPEIELSIAGRDAAGRPLTLAPGDPVLVTHGGVAAASA